MDFAIDSLASDAERLIPLFANNSKQLNTLKGRFNDVNSSMAITVEQADELKIVSTNFDLMQKTAGQAATAISATLAPILNDFINDIIAVVPDATQTIIDFTNSFLDPKNINSESGVKKEIIASSEALSVLLAEQKEYKAKLEDATITSGYYDLQLMNTNASIREETERLKELNEQLVILEENKAKRLEGGEIGGETGGVVGLGADKADGDGTGDQVKAIADRFKTEEELLREKLATDLEIIGEDKELKLALEEEFLESLFNLHVAADEKMAELKRKQDKDLEKKKKKLFKDEEKQRKIEDKIAKQNANRDRQFANDAMTLAGLVFEDNKAVSAGIALVNTAQGVTKALSTQDYAGAAITGVMGAAQIAAILGASKGGGSIPTVASAPPVQQQQQFTPETESIELTEQTGNEGLSVQRIIISTDDGNDIFDGIAQGLENRARNGA
jgi:hypothetical protein